MAKSSARKKECYGCPACFEEFETNILLSCHACPMKLDPAVEVEIETRPEDELLIPCDTVLQEFGDQVFKCKICPRRFKTARGCNVHTSTHTKKGTRKRRQKKSNIPNSDSDNMAIVRTKRQYVCSHCDHVSERLGDYRKHFKTHDNNQIATTVDVVPCPTINVHSNFMQTQNLHKCPNCKEKFIKIGSYRRHLRTHLNIHAYTCKYCFLSFMAKSQLIDHVKRLHQGDEKYSCSLCDKKFIHRLGYINHQMEHNDPPYQCLSCVAKFPSTSRRIVHFNNHTLTCPFCRKACANDESMWQHINAVHEGEIENADFLSDLSEPDDTDSNGELTDNEFNELDVESDADSYTSTDSSSEEIVYCPRKGGAKGHVCFICERRFSKETSLEFHMKLHEIYQCKACPKFFPHFHELKTHQQEHVQTNLNFYTKAFDDLCNKSAEIATPFCVANNPLDVTQTSEFTLQTPTITTDFISWYSEFKQRSQFLKYPIGNDLLQSITQIIAELTSTLNNQPKLPRDTKDSYIKIYKELSAINSKNAKHYVW